MAAHSNQQHASSHIFALAQLVRLPNVFTAIADVMMGYLISRGGYEPWQWFGLMVATTVALYWAGMVLNDVYDVETDRRERPDRPIPSGRIELGAARRIGFGLLGAGVALAGMASARAGTTRPILWAALLVMCIMLYDRRAKSTPLGPLVMGMCRAVNVLLGMSLAIEPVSGMLRPWHPYEWWISAGIGAYTAGVTWLARNEADTSARSGLIGGLAVMVGALALIGSLPAWTEFPMSPAIRPQGWYLFWMLLALVIARRCVLAILQPTPDRVQAAVKNSILSLIVINAGITLGVCGMFWGCAVLLLLAPALLLGKWIYST
jgi:4-hydroxybenzoate polyprenyltransferase